MPPDHAETVLPSTDTPAREIPRRQTWLSVLALCLFAGLILAAQLSRMRAVPDLGDPLFSVWRMGWVFQQVSGDDRRLFDANIFHPEPLTFTFSDSILLPSLAAAPLRAIGMHPVVVYNVMLIASFILSACAAYVLVARLTGSSAAGFVSGLVFGFYPYRFEHYSHLELQMTMLMPLTLWAVFLFVTRHRARWIALAASLAAGQFYSSMYYGVFFALYTGVVFVVWSLAESSSRRPRFWLQVLGAALLGAVIIAPLAKVYLGSTNVRQGRGLAEVAHYSATPVDFLRAHRQSTFWAELTPAGREAERQLFPGFTVLLLAVLGAAASRDRKRWAFVAGAVFAFDASLGTNGLVYPHLYEWLPPFRSMRVPARFSILVGLSLAVLGGYGIARFAPRFDRRGVLVMGLVTLGVAVDAWAVVPLKDVWEAPPSVYAALEGQRDVVLAEFPAGSPERFSATPYMYFSVWHGRQMINGYSGYTPETYTRALDTLERFPASETLDLLQTRGVTHVTVNCTLFELAGYGERCDRVLTGAARSPRLRELARSQWEGHTVVLFEMR